MSEATVLVVDDERGVRELVSYQLRGLDDVEVLEAADGAEARRILVQREVDVVITDLLMPNLGGLELLRWAQRERPGPAWIVLSGLETFDTAVEAIRGGAYDFLTKPPEPERLRVSVGHALERVRMAGERRALLARLDARNLELRQRVEQLEVLCDALERQAEEIDRDLERAEAIQRALLPSRPPPLGAFRVETLYRPGHYVGGDLYDVVSIDDRYAGLLIADACGHGVSAAMLSVLFKQRLRLRDEASGEPLPPASVLAEANEALVNSAAPGLFVTAAYGLLDTETGELDLASAGHPPMLWAQDAGRVSSIERTGPALGVEGGAQYGEVRVQLERGDRLLLFTDGVLGVHGAGLARVREVVQSAPSVSAILAALREGALAAGNGDDVDDATAIVLEARVGPNRLDASTPDGGCPGGGSTAELLGGLADREAWVQVRGRGTWREAEDFLAYARRAADRCDRIHLDVGSCTHLDSTFLGTVHELVCEAEGLGCEPVLQGVGPALFRLFDELSMDRVLGCIRTGAPAPPCRLEPILAPASFRPSGERVLRAHQLLASLSARNREEFRAVIEGLRAELGGADARLRRA